MDKLFSLLRTILIIVTGSTVLFGIYKSWNKMLLANHNNFLVEKIQFIAVLFLMAAFGLSLWGTLWGFKKLLLRLKEMDNKIEEIPQTVKKEVAIQTGEMGGTLKLLRDLAVARTIRDGNSEAMKILNKYGLT